jgi:hypothetical protein
MIYMEIMNSEKYYPESDGLTIIINAPIVFWGCWQIIKPWLCASAREKVSIHHFIYIIEKGIYNINKQKQYNKSLLIRCCF